MKKRKATARKNPNLRVEGTLEEFVFTSESGDDFDEATAVASAVSIVGFSDFIAKARGLANRMSDAPEDSLRGQRAASLLRDLHRLDIAIRQGVNEAALYDAIGAALTYSSLRHEAENDSDRTGKITVQQYLKLKRQGLIDKQIAAVIGVWPSKLSKWKRLHLPK